MEKTREKWVGAPATRSNIRCRNSAPVSGEHEPRAKRAQLTKVNEASRLDDDARDRSAVGRCANAVIAGKCRAVDRASRCFAHRADELSVASEPVASASEPVASASEPIASASLVEASEPVASASEPIASASEPIASASLVEASEPVASASLVEGSVVEAIIEAVVGAWEIRAPLFRGKRVLGLRGIVALVVEVVAASDAVAVDPVARVALRFGCCGGRAAICDRA